ncbi:hypothetical protein EON81_16155 [bacterium]|nr:MAG: hypothetical protein EON81_16155 [bacterium]
MTIGIFDFVAATEQLLNDHKDEVGSLLAEAGWDPRGLTFLGYHRASPPVDILPLVMLEPQRIRREWVSLNNGARFTATIGITGVIMQEDPERATKEITLLEQGVAHVINVRHAEAKIGREGYGLFYPGESGLPISEAVFGVIPAGRGVLHAFQSTFTAAVEVVIPPI